MPKFKNHLEVRSISANMAEERGLNWKCDGSVLPSKPNKYSTIFMTAQRERLGWVYDPEKPETDNTKEMGTGWCVRSDAIPKAGRSNRHLAAFEMLSMEGRLREEDAINTMVELIRETTGVVMEQIDAVTGRGNATARAVLTDLNIRTIDGDTSFKRPDTNRSGHRVEIGINFGEAESPQRWEVQNLVVLDKIGGQTLQTPIIDSGGSFERLVTIAEGHGDVFKSSLMTPIVDIVGEMMHDSGQRSAEKIADLARSTIIMSRSGYVVGTENRQQQTYRKLCREMGMASIEQGLSIEDITTVLEAADEEMEGWGVYPELFENGDNHLTDSGLTGSLEKLFDNFERIKSELKAKGGATVDMNLLANKLSRKYDGGADNGLAHLALKRLQK